MKKLQAIFLVVIYLSVSSGVVMNFHYCMGKIAEITLGKTQANKCGKCGMENTGCCNDEVKVIKLQDSHQAAHVQAEISSLPALNEVYHYPLSWSFTSLSSVSHLKNHSPPGYGEPALCIKNCVFRI